MRQIDVLVETIKRNYQNWHPPIPRDAHIPDSRYSTYRKPAFSETENPKSPPFKTIEDELTGEILLVPTENYKE